MRDLLKALLLTFRSICNLLGSALRSLTALLRPKAILAATLLAAESQLAGSVQEPHRPEESAPSAVHESLSAVVGRPVEAAQFLGGLRPSDAAGHGEEVAHDSFPVLLAT